MWKFLAIAEAFVIVAGAACVFAFYYRGKIEEKAQRHGSKKKKKVGG